MRPELTLEHLIILGLICILGISQVFWAIQVHTLTNKLMSRDFFEYNSITAKKSKKPAPATPDDAVVDPDAERTARELNTLFNVM